MLRDPEAYDPDLDAPPEDDETGLLDDWDSRQLRGMTAPEFSKPRRRRMKRNWNRPQF